MSSKILLLLEDKKNFCILTNLLEKQYEICLHKQGYFPEHGFDLCVTDSLSYQKYQQQLSSIEKTNNLLLSPILLLTNQQELQGLISKFAQNIDEVILTPIIEQELLLRVKKLLENRHLLRQNKIASRMRSHALLSELASKHKQGEIASQENDNLLRTIIDANPDPIVVKDIQGRYQLINSALAKLFNRSAKEIIGKDDSVFFPSHLVRRLVEDDQRLLSSGGSETFEEVVMINGQSRIHRTTKAAYYNCQGDVSGLVVVARDITDLKYAQQLLHQANEQLEERVKERTAALSQANEQLQKEIKKGQRAAEALKRSERKFRAIFNQTFQFIGLLQPDGKVIEANQTALDFGGFALSEIVGKPFWQAPWWTASTTSQKCLKAAIAKAARGEFVRCEIEMQGAGNHKLVIDFSLKSIKDETGQVILLIPEGRDISERKKAEVALFESEQRLHLFVEYAPSAIAMFDHQMRYLAVSKRWLKDYGVEGQELIGCSHYEVFPENSQRWQKIHASCLAGAVQKCEEDLFVRLDGSTDWVRWEVHPWRNHQGEVEGIIMFSELITERKQAKEKLKAANVELARSNSELEQFAYIASHDLREPLRKIKSYTELLSESYQGQLDEKADRYIFYVTDAVTRMQELISDLLGYSRLGKGELVAESINLGVVAEEALSDLGQTIEENQAAVIVEPLPMVQAHPGQIRQLLQNLISNALKFRGKMSPEIKIKAEKQDKQWVISISDNGIGIKPEYAERVFQIFQRLHSRSKYPGTGIGLAICKKIVEHHGGRIWIESEFGNGTTFYFTLKAEGNSNGLSL
ncbi:MAG: PAS domain-containing protein [Coleofasciculaceae cyanobacterium]